MLKSRLETVSPDLVNGIEKASDAQKRAICTAVATLAVRTTKLNDTAVDAGLRALESGRYGPGPVTVGLERVAEDLDNQYFKAYQQFEAGKCDKAAYQELFAKARAVSAVFFALEKDPFHAAAEATYEAISAIGIDDPRSVVDGILQ